MSLVETLNIDDDGEGEGSVKSLGCFSCSREWVFGKGKNDGSNSLLLPKQQVKKECFLKQKAENIRGISELLKWKNFIRRFLVSNYKKRRVACQYDPQSCALNFDDGEAVVGCPHFLARCSANANG